MDKVPAAKFFEMMDKYHQVNQQAPALGEFSIILAFLLGTLIVVAGAVFLVIRMRKMSQKEDKENKPVSPDNETVTHVMIATQMRELETSLVTRITEIKTDLKTDIAGVKTEVSEIRTVLLAREG